MSRRFAVDDILDVALWCALAAAVGAFLLVEVYDLDIWWHVAIGRDILAHGRVPVSDLYTAAAAGRPYHDSHWLFQVVVALADRFAGMTGVQLVMIGLWGGVLVAVWQGVRSNTRVAPVGALLCFLAAMACSERFLPRPEVVTILMISWFALLLQQGRHAGWRGKLLFVSLQIIWCNSHGLFVLGPFLVGCYWLCALLGRDEESASRDVQSLGGLLLLLLAATLVTPFGLSGWKYALLLFVEAGPAAPEMLAKVGELSPTFGPASRGGMAFWFYAALLAVTVFTTFLGRTWRERSAWPRLLIVAVLFALSLTGRRNMALFAVVAPALAAEGVRRLPWRFPVAIGRGASVTLIVGFGFSLWLALSGSYYVQMQLPARSGFGSTPSFFPHPLVEELRKSGFHGQVLNSNTLGGFWLYHFYPAAKTMTDGRWEIYAPETFGQLGNACKSRAGWEQLCKTYQLEGVLLQHASPEARSLLPLLHSGVGWKLIYLDRAASFWVPAVASDFAEVSPAAVAARLSPVTRIDDVLIFDQFLQLTGEDRLRLDNLASAYAAGLKTPLLLENLGAVQIQLQLYSEAETVFVELLQARPRNPRALNELAFLAFRRGDRARAENYLRRLLAVDPQNVDANNNLRLLQNGAVQ